MLYLVINEFDEIVGRFKDLNRAMNYLKERNDNSIIKEVTFKQYEEMKKNFLKNYWQKNKKRYNKGVKKRGK